MKPLAILTDPVYKEHRPGEGHPERPERMDAVSAALERAGALKDALRLSARAAIDDELALCHTRQYLSVVKREVAGGSTAWRSFEPRR